MRAFSGALAALSLAVAIVAAGSPAASAAATPTPTCVEGPVREGQTIVGTPCADTIVVPAGVARVEGGAGNDTIVPSPLAASSCPEGCFLGVGSQTFEGGPGDDVVYGQRGNDKLRGGEGNDRLYGGIGDDLLEGGPGDDLLAGGFGADSIDGQEGNDYVRGDGTIDRIYDSGGGFDTLSYAGGVTPGFGGGIETGVSGVPTGEEGERGVYLDLSKGGENGNDGKAALGGGVDEVQQGAFERIIGTPYSDYIVGSAAGEAIDGGGGADVIRGGGGNDTILGGADGDFLEGGPTATLDGEAGSDNCVGGAAQTSCEGTAATVTTRDTSKVSVGETTSASGLVQLYLTGSEAGDAIHASYTGSAVTFTLTGSSFDQGAADAAGCAPTPTTATCPLPAPVDSIVLAGMGGNDAIEASGFPASTGVVLSGGAGSDQLTGGEPSEDVLVDGLGEGEDTLSALGGDDALLHNGGRDELLGGTGNDLFLSVSICDGELLSGGEGRDNASWARLPGTEVDARLDQGTIGEPGPAEAPQCAAGSLDAMQGIEDLEGSESPDVLFGDEGPNQLLGHRGSDTYRALGGDDSILANSADSDAVIDCGEGNDSALIDIPHPGEYEDPPPIGCESVRTAAPNNFETQTELPPPPPLPEPPPVVPPDTRPPRTRLVHHPRALLLSATRHRRVSFAFASDEQGSRFRCRLDHRRYVDCRSPRAYNVGLGHHSFRVFAIDAAGNADPTPARFEFRLRARRAR